MTRQPTRRQVLMQAGALVVAGTAACSTARPQAPATEATPSRNSTEPGATVLLAYFSRPGENYHYGGRHDLTVGNTEVVARLIAERLPVDVYRIEAADPYPFSYDATVARNVREQEEGARPALAMPPPAVESYDVVLLGSPVWNVRAPMIMRTMLEQLDLRGRTILPFVTFAVSGMGRVADEYATVARAATVGKGLAVQGEVAHDAGPDVQNWLRDAGLIGR